MEELEINGLRDTIKAILILTVQTHIAITAQNTFLIENINNGQSYEENTKMFSEISDKARSVILSDLYVSLKDLDLGDLLSGK